MEIMPIPVLIFYSIPESLLLITLSSTLYGYDVRGNFKRIFLLSIGLALTTYIVRALPIKFGENVLIQLPIFIFLTAYFLKITIKRSLFIVFTVYVVILLVESTYVQVMVSLTGMELNLIIRNIWSRLLMSCGQLLILLIPTLFVVKKKITFASAASFVKTATLDTKITLTILLILSQAFLAGFLQSLSVWGKGPIWPVYSTGIYLQRMIGVSLIAIPIISIIFLKRLFTLSEQEATAAAQEAYLDSINDLFATVQGQRHDFINHIQVLQGLVHLKKFKETADYLNQLVGETRETNEILRVDNLAVTALLRSKQAVSIARKTPLKIEVSCSLKNLKIKPFHLVKILGNLLDNAMHAAAGQSEKRRQVSFSIFREDDFIVFQVCNPRPVIPPEILPQIFTPGFTTKEEDHAGQGLFIVKKLVTENGGLIDVSSDEIRGTRFTVKLPL